MLYLIGLGLSWKDLSLKALEALSICDKVYLESYTSVSDFSPMKLSRLIGKTVKALNRKDVEENRTFVKEASIQNIALLVYGDALSATTHNEILAECKKKKIQYQIIHGPSIISAIAETGLSLYKFGKTASIPFWEKNFQPESFFDILEDNQKIGAHTLFLLDLRPDEQRFLSIPDAIKVLLQIGMKRKGFTDSTKCIGCARLGFKDQQIIRGTAKDLASKKFGSAPYCLIVPSKLSEYELQ